ncbi:glutathione S-transferase family protein [Chachezhania sediminis]|uniref:glutathione S-transferase family protein n=1 Tax=Chachezhania sediminis TaxID=2599291 RepID=UPI00131BBE39|nr:glutathione S-transferase family protein [Chachezhania sediminis]
MLTVWGRRTSSNVQALMWCIGELDLPFIRHNAGHRYGVTDTPAFAALNPNRTVPVLQDGDDPPLWETGAILRYLAGRYARDTFWPVDPVARADVDRWAEWAKINVALGFTAPVFWRVVRTPAAQRDPDAIRQAVTALERFLAIADTRLAQSPFLAGNSFTLADIQFGHVLHRYFDIDTDRAPLPALADYYTRLVQRPAYREHVMVDYEELRA